MKAGELKRIEEQLVVARCPCSSKSLLLVQRIKGGNARFRVRASAGGIDTNHGVFHRAERPDARLIDRDRCRKNRVTNVHTTRLVPRAGRELVAALSTASRISIVRQHRIDDTSGGRARNASRAERTAKIYESGSISHRGIRALVSDLSGGNSANRLNGRRLIGGHAS